VIIDNFTVAFFTLRCMWQYSSVTYYKWKFANNSNSNNNVIVEKYTAGIYAEAFSGGNIFFSELWHRLKL